MSLFRSRPTYCVFLILWTHLFLHNYTVDHFWYVQDTSYKRSIFYFCYRFTEVVRDGRREGGQFYHNCHQVVPLKFVQYNLVWFFYYFFKKKLWNSWQKITRKITFNQEGCSPITYNNTYFKRSTWILLCEPLTVGY